ncbi:hypothetical protein OF83DRAFT_1180462 [Amylostereum chailletii]|nr:hypothetical protein OF83DRAFT_1180462 [Amylostereum chailletii]
MAHGLWVTRSPRVKLHPPFKRALAPPDVSWSVHLRVCHSHMLAGKRPGCTAPGSYRPPCYGTPVGPAPLDGGGLTALFGRDNLNLSSQLLALTGKSLTVIALTSAQTGHVVLRVTTWTDLIQLSPFELDSRDAQKTMEVTVAKGLALDGGTEDGWWSRFRGPAVELEDGGEAGLEDQLGAFWRSDLGVKGEDTVP